MKLKEQFQSNFEGDFKSSRKSAWKQLQQFQIHFRTVLWRFRETSNELFETFPRNFKGNFSVVWMQWRQRRLKDFWEQFQSSFQPVSLNCSSIVNVILVRRDGCRISKAVLKIFFKSNFRAVPEPRSSQKFRDYPHLLSEVFQGIFGSVLGQFWVGSGSVSEHFWDIFGSVLGQFWGNFWDGFGAFFGYFWVSFGAILRQFFCDSFGAFSGQFGGIFRIFLGQFWSDFGIFLGQFWYSFGVVSPKH